MPAEQDEAPAPGIARCTWAVREPSIFYHDTEWGVPQHDDRMLFEMLTLEGAQAGLSWETILRKRAGYRAAFALFDPALVAEFTAAQATCLAANPAIVRHAGKIAATIGNARAFCAVQQEFGSFAAYLWGFVNGEPVVTPRRAGEVLPSRTALSDRVSQDLRRRGFRFVGTTIVYAFLQATGVVNDHQAHCFRVTGQPQPASAP